MNKNILIGIGGVVLAGVGYGLYKIFNKSKKDNADKSVEITKEGLSEIKEHMKESFENLNNHAEKIGKDFNKKVSDDLIKAEIDILGMPLEDYIKNKKSINDQDMFEDKVTDSKEFETLNEIRKAAGNKPIKMNENLEKFLGKDSKNKSVKESLDNIAENIKKDPKLKKKILAILHE